MQALPALLSPEAAPASEVSAPPPGPAYRPLWMAVAIGGASVLSREKVVECCRRYTPQISVAPPDAVLLEIRGSLALFGGLPALVRKFSRMLADLGCETAVSVTPVPSASLVFARQGREVLIEDCAQLRPALAGLPVRALAISTESASRLERMGASHLRELWRLPRDGLARRFGRELPAQLDRLAGQAADLRQTCRPPLRFVDVCPLPAETADVLPILAAARRLLRRLVAFLQRHDAAVAGFRLLLKPQRHPPVECRVSLRSPTRDLGRLEHLLAERLHSLRLPARIVELEVRAEDIGQYAPGTGDLFPKAAAGPGSEPERIWEVLEARLGPQCLGVPLCRADHRPEAAGGESFSAGAGYEEHSGPTRPLWLLDAPEPLAGDSPPRWRGRPLRLHSGPERIEAGWWDGRERRRDYYRAGSTDGLRLWIFRDLEPTRRWWLHGYWG